MTALKALAILESAVLECKKRDINTPEVKNALDLLEPYIWPKWVVPQFRDNVENEGEPLENREGQQQVLRATFPGIRDAVRELLRVRMDALARKFHETHDMAVKDELEHMLKEYGKLKEPWVFVAR
jgi:hypothetical protein